MTATTADRRHLDFAAQDGFWVLDTAGHILQANQAYCQMIGYSETELLGMRTYDVDVGGAAAGVAEHMGVLMRDGPVRYESQHRHKDGSLINVEVSAFCLRTSSSLVFGLIRDMTEHHKTQALATMQALSIAALSDAMYWTTSDGRIHDVNAAACHALGCSKVTLKGRRVVDFNPQWTAEVWAQYFAELKARGSLRFEYDQPQRNGHVVPVEVITNYVRCGDAELTVSTARELTERRAAERALAESERRYRLMFNLMSEGFCVVEMMFDQQNRPVDYCFLDVNPAFEAQTGLHNVVGRRMRELVPDHEAYWFELFGTVATTGSPIRFENEARALQRWYEVSAFRVGGSDSRNVGIIFEDVSERVRRQTAVAKQLDELIRWQSVMLDREDRIQQLKLEANQLSCRLGEQPRYASAAPFTGAADGGAGARASS